MGEHMATQAAHEGDASTLSAPEYRVLRGFHDAERPLA
jgi:hypothetical protein